MASEAILVQKQAVIDEIKERTKNAKTVVLFDYRGITDAEAKELRVKLRDVNADYKVYKNTLMSRAFNDLGIDLNEALSGPSAFAFGEDQVAPIKVLSDFAKEHPAFISGMRTFLSGHRIFIVSPIKCTPHIIKISAFTRVACCASAKESPMKSAISCISGRV